MFLFAATPVDSDIAIWILRKRGQQNRTHVGEARATSDQDQWTVFVFAQPGFAVRNIHVDFTLFQDAVHHRHGIQIKL
ncbi:hypothetical protein D3C85_1553380 [compost metagenome]